MADGPDRHTKLSIDLGDQVEFVRIVANEGLSQHFTMTLEVHAKLGPIDFLGHLGKPACVTVKEEGEEKRYFHGLLADAEFIGEVHTVDETGKQARVRPAAYQLTLKPAAHFHSQGRNFRVFQNKSTLDIIEAVLTKCDIKHTLEHVTNKGNFKPRAYCVQYGESDFGFVSRLMEEDGLYYFYEHSQSQHQLLVCDAPGSHKNGTASPLTYVETSRGLIDVNVKGGRFDGTHYLHEWRERVSSGAEQKVTLRDFDFMKSSKVEGATTLKNEHPIDAVEFYHYPARTFVDAVGKDRSNVLLEARRANRRTYIAESNNAAIVCGQLFEMSYPTDDGFKDRFDKKSFLVTQTRHALVSETYASSQGMEAEHAIQFEAVPAETPWRAPMTTRRPVVLGPETAWVTGPSDKEIYTDKWGRVKVQFHWDREGKFNEESSCWVRVSQTGGLGNVILPRIGHEVIVDFIDGDPDRPIVVGRVFNSKHEPHYTLPANLTIQSWRSKTVKEGGALTTDWAQTGQKWVGIPNLGLNEVRFEDKRGKEEMFLYAQKDRNDLIQDTQNTKIGTDFDLKVGQNRTMKVGKDDTTTIVGKRDTTIQKDEKRTVNGKRETKVDGTELLDVGQMITIKSGTEIMIEAANKITLQVGSSTITIKDGEIEVKTKTLKTTGNTQAEHKGGSGTITMDMGGITQKGPMIKLN